jgi:hypothetical protein
MDCDRFREYLADVDRPGVLAPELCGQIFAHAEECGECGELLTESESLETGLRRLAAKDAGLQAPPGLERRMTAEFREWQAGRRRRAAWRYASAMSIAAVLLVAIGVWIGRSGPGHKPLADLTTGRSPVTIRPVIQAQTNQPIARATQPTPRRTAGAERVEAAANSRAARSSTGLADEIDDRSGFIALSDVDEAAPLDEAAVVQVEMPRAALASFGLPVEAMEGSGTVRADLIVSADGTPQAIRLDSQDQTNAVQP